MCPRLSLAMFNDNLNYVITVIFGELTPICFSVRKTPMGNSKDGNILKTRWIFFRKQAQMKYVLEETQPWSMTFWPFGPLHTCIPWYNKSWVSVLYHISIIFISKKEFFIFSQDSDLTTPNVCPLTNCKIIFKSIVGGPQGH